MNWSRKTISTRSCKDTTKGNNLGTTYWTLAEVEEKSENCKKVIKAYREALKVYTKEEFPEPHQIIETNLRILLEFCKD